jgi:hypothetical protein
MHLRTFFASLAPERSYQAAPLKQLADSGIPAQIKKWHQHAACIFSGMYVHKEVLCLAPVYLCEAARFQKLAARLGP